MNTGQPVDFSAYRAQMTAIDLLHIVLIVVVILVILYLAVECHKRDDDWYALWIPPFTVTVVGLVMRLDTMVHRIGAFLFANGDPWEHAKALHAPTAYLMPWADALVFVPVIGLFVWGLIRAYEHLWPSLWRWPYVVLMIALLLSGIAGWMMAATRAKTGFGGG